MSEQKSEMYKRAELYAEGICPNYRNVAPCRREGSAVGAWNGYIQGWRDAINHAAKTCEKVRQKAHREKNEFQAKGALRCREEVLKEFE